VSAIKRKNQGPSSREWDFWRTRTCALFLQASCSMTLILIVVIPSVFSWSMLGLRLSSAISGYLRQQRRGRALKKAYPVRAEHIQNG